jgi:hypothetical protein
MLRRRETAAFQLTLLIFERPLSRAGEPRGTAAPVSAQAKPPLRCGQAFRLTRPIRSTETNRPTARVASRKPPASHHNRLGLRDEQLPSRSRTGGRPRRSDATTKRRCRRGSRRSRPRARPALTATSFACWCAPPANDVDRTVAEAAPVPGAKTRRSTAPTGEHRARRVQARRIDAEQSRCRQRPRQAPSVPGGAATRSCWRLVSERFRRAGERHPANRRECPRRRRSSRLAHRRLQLDLRGGLGTRQKWPTTIASSTSRTKRRMKAPDSFRGGSRDVHESGPIEPPTPPFVSSRDRPEVLRSGENPRPTRSRSSQDAARTCRR